METFQAFQEFFAESTGKMFHRAKKPLIPNRLKETGIHQTAAGDQKMNMWMQFKILSPGVKHGDETGHGSQVFFSRRNFC